MIFIHDFRLTILDLRLRGDYTVPPATSLWCRISHRLGVMLDFVRRVSIMTTN